MRKIPKIALLAAFLFIAFLLDFEPPADKPDSLEVRIGQATYLLKAYGYTDRQISQIIGTHN